MGYESKLYVVDKRRIAHKIDGKEYVWGEVIASFDLCKVYPVSDKMREYPITNCYIYADDGNTQILEDCYGEPLKEIPLDDAIGILEDAAGLEDYRRYEPCIALLKGFKQSQWQWNNLVVLHYGH